MISNYFIPDSVNKVVKAGGGHDIEGGVEEVHESELAVAYKAVLTNRSVMISTFSCILATIVLLFSEPIITDHMIDIGVSENFIGYIFAASCLSYALAAPLVGNLTNIYTKEALTLFAFGLSGVALLF